MGVGASRAVGTGDTGGTKGRDEGVSVRRATGDAHTGRYIYYLNQATGGSIDLTLVVKRVDCLLVRACRREHSHSPGNSPGGSIVLRAERIAFFTEGA